MAAPAVGQIVRLPPVIPQESAFHAEAPSPFSGSRAESSGPPAQLTGYLDPNSDQAQPDDSLPPEAFTPKQPPGVRPGVLQRVSLVSTWLSGRDADDLELLDFDFKVALGIPAPTTESPLLITPGLGAHFLDGPDPTDLPAQVYDLWLDVRWIMPVADCWTMDMGITPGWYSDFQQSSLDAFRMGARAMAMYSHTPETKWVMGVVYLDREDFPFLPALGCLWNPDLDTRWELILPRPKFARRYSVVGSMEKWWYLSGEFGGGSWAIERKHGREDVANYSDWRVAIGQELKRAGSTTAWFELGYVFNRQIDYTSRSRDFEPANTFMFRVGAGF